MRTKKNKKLYDKRIKDRVDTDCPFCSKNRKEIISYNYWAIIENAYPYDLIADVSHILISRNHNQTSIAEFLELGEIIGDLERDHYYSTMTFNFSGAKSIKSHQHFHLLRLK